MLVVAIRSDGVVKALEAKALEVRRASDGKAEVMVSCVWGDIYFKVDGDHRDIRAEVVNQLVLHSDHTPTVVLKNVIDEWWGEEEEDYA